MVIRSLAGTVFAAALACTAVFTTPAQARAVVAVAIGVAPPPLRVERVGVRVGYVWAPGYWRWNGVRHVWVGGAWVAKRPGWRYVGAGWVRVGPQWRFHRAHWVHA